MVEEKLLIEEMSMSELLGEMPEKVRNGNLVQARVLGKNADGVLVDIGLKMEGLIPRGEFADFDNALPFQEGDIVPVIIRQMEGGDAHTRVSWRSARELGAWDKLAVAFQAGTVLEGTVQRKVKGGYVVDIGLDAFLPGSQVDIRPSKDVDVWLKKTIPVVITELDRAKSNVVVSRRKVLERERQQMREKTLAGLAEGQVVAGMVTSVTNFGAFVDIGGIEGLLHVSDISWNRGEKPENVLKVGQAIQVKILKYDSSTQRISLGLKQLQPHPWDGVVQRYPVGATVKGKVTTMTKFGAFIELEPGVEGLLHISELAWKERVSKPEDVLKPSEGVTVKVLLVDPSKEKLSLSLKRVGESPWAIAKANHPVGSRVKGAVTHLTPFGAFVMLPEGIEGLIHVSDLSWTQKVQHPSEVVSLGQEVEVVIQDVKVDAEKIGLSYKHTQPDPLSSVRNGSSVEGKVSAVRDDGSITVDLGNGIEGVVRRPELSEDANGDAITPEAGTDVSAKVMRVETRERRVELSIRRQDRDEERQMLKRYSGRNQEPITLGDVLLDTQAKSSTGE